MTKGQKTIGAFILIGVIGAVIVYLPMHKHQQSKVQQSVRQSQVARASDKLPKGVRASDWQLLLVNKQHIHQNEINFKKVTVDTKQLDQRIEQPLADFRAGSKQAGYTTTLVSAYRSVAYQTQIYNQSIAQHEADGLSQSEATKLTQSVIQTPGSSEHQTGLAVDLAGSDAVAKYPMLMAQMDEFASQKWLIQHAPDYGFVLRYMNDKKSVAQTGIDYESWHFRYVGVANAKYMTKHHLTLEAYVDELTKSGKI
ncbi:MULTISPECIES: D-alanyl-D-alanine carboxypeptidase family protein [Leuconostoc]|uniref:Serine-type D-Ala-D-Ala carboxypeptidase n=2 Tax=Leuconostoc kimchii TaxID=136609 RepID=D5T3T4_LEUKI|nr:MULTISPECIES: M15 family metallopeptidase [Leuconostoc]ADG40933.1 serine-type D-Ala-D-Ala carboxypeptidase [Leuconostoc kimchii IMSNU 11154]AEJ31093.1 serine-type D-Ala-D-Ala carboxypeptidase [Leuconostoc sp. C2]QBR48182.1 D-alanyl-D-alanine carboxypeptidase family protein [Leuconostoc kimchii]